VANASKQPGPPLFTSRRTRMSRIEKYSYARFLPKLIHSFLSCFTFGLKIISEGCGRVHLVTIPEPILRLIGLPGDLQRKEIQFAQMQIY